MDQIGPGYAPLGNLMTFFFGHENIFVWIFVYIDPKKGPGGPGIPLDGPEATNLR